MSLKILYASDIHLEFAECDLPMDEAVENADLVVAAGDIGVGHDGLTWLSLLTERASTPVVYVAGNHEFYRHDRLELIDHLRHAAAAIPGFHFLENGSVNVRSQNGETWRILGATLWTDYEAGPLNRLNSQMAADLAIPDFRIIREGTEPFTTDRAIDASRVSRTFIEDALVGADADSGIAGSIVVTHHAPLLAPWTRADFAGNPLNPAFCNEWPELFETRRISAWIAGHTHKETVDEVFHGCRLLAHQRGCPGESTRDEPFEFATAVIEPWRPSGDGGRGEL